MKIYGIYYNEVTKQFEVVEVLLGSASRMILIMQEYKIIACYSRSYVWQVCKDWNAELEKEEWKSMTWKEKMAKILNMPVRL